MCRLAELREFMSRKGGIRMVGLARCRNGRRTHTHIMYDFTLTFYRLYTYIHSWRPSPLPIIFHNLDTSSKKTSPYSNVTLLSSLFSFPCSLFPFPFPLPLSPSFLPFSTHVESNTTSIHRHHRLLFPFYIHINLPTYHKVPPAHQPYILAALVYHK